VKVNLFDSDRRQLQRVIHEPESRFLYHEFVSECDEKDASPAYGRVTQTGGTVAAEGLGQDKSGRKSHVTNLEKLLVSPYFEYPEVGQPVYKKGLSGCTHQDIIQTCGIRLGNLGSESSNVASNRGAAHQLPVLGFCGRVPSVSTLQRAGQYRR
jgi:hypothetical protein